MKDDTRFMCWRCSKTFKRQKFLDAHLNRKFPCKIIEPDDLVENSDEEEEEYNFSFSELPTFDFDNFFEKTKFPTICLIGVRRAGKTTWIKHFYQYLKTLYDMTFFISNSIHNKEVYGFVDGCSFPKHEPSMFNDILHFAYKTNNLLTTLLIMDDCISRGSRAESNLAQIFFRGRNSKIGLILSTQSTVYCEKSNRQNCDLYLIANGPAEHRKFIVEHLLDGLVKVPKRYNKKGIRMQYLKSFFIEKTKDYNFIVVDNIKQKLYSFQVPF